LRSSPRSDIARIIANCIIYLILYLFPLASAKLRFKILILIIDVLLFLNFDVSYKIRIFVL
jgi:hypothetical protein